MAGAGAAAGSVLLVTIAVALLALQVSSLRVSLERLHSVMEGIDEVMGDVLDHLEQADRRDA